MDYPSTEFARESGDRRLLGLGISDAPLSCKSSRWRAHEATLRTELEGPF